MRPIQAVEVGGEVGRAEALEERPSAGGQDDVYAGRAQRRRHLEADEAGADDRHAPGRVSVLANGERIVDRPQRERAVEGTRVGSGRDQQLLEADLLAGSVEHPPPEVH